MVNSMNGHTPLKLVEPYNKIIITDRSLDDLLVIGYCAAQYALALLLLCPTKNWKCGS